MQAGMRGQAFDSHPIHDGWETIEFSNGEFDPGSGRTLAAWIRHASRAETRGWILRMKTPKS